MEAVEMRATTNTLGCDHAPDELDDGDDEGAKGNRSQVVNERVFHGSHHRQGGHLFPVASGPIKRSNGTCKEEAIGYVGAMLTSQGSSAKT